LSTPETQVSEMKSGLGLARGKFSHTNNKRTRTIYKGAAPAFSTADFVLSAWSLAVSFVDMYRNYQVGGNIRQACYYSGCSK
jgi:hypothetical protein